MEHVLILTSDAGFGHRQVAKVLYDALDCEATIVNPMQHDKTPDLIQQLEEGYSERVSERGDLYKATYDFVDLPLMTEVVRQGMTRILKGAMTQLVDTHQPDVIVSTYPMYAEPIMAAVGDRSIPLYVIITDLGEVQNVWFSGGATCHFVATDIVRQQGLEQDIPVEKLLVTGLPVDPAFGEPADSTPTWAGGDAPVALIVGGPRSEGLVALAEDLSTLDVTLVVVAGGSDDLYARLQESDSLGGAHIFNWVDDMPGFVRAADFVITKAGGVIVSEVLAAGKPLIITEALPGQEEGNVTYLLENGAGIHPEDIPQAVQQWLDDGFDDYTERAQALGKPEAVYTIIEALE